jgi:hypothetical protein
MDLTKLLEKIPDLVRGAAARRERTKQARHKLEQIREDLQSCAAMYVRGTQSGVVNFTMLPTDSLPLLLELHREGFISDDGVRAVRAFMEPAVEANASLTRRPAFGPPGFAGASYVRHLSIGRSHVEDRDSSGTTPYERSMAAIAESLTDLDKRIF